MVRTVPPNLSYMYRYAIFCIVQYVNFDTPMSLSHSRPKLGEWGRGGGGGINYGHGGLYCSNLLSPRLTKNIQNE